MGSELTILLRPLRLHAGCWKAAPTQLRAAANCLPGTVRWRSFTLAFGTVAFTFDQWLLCAAMARNVLWFSELRKLWGRARGR